MGKVSVDSGLILADIHTGLVAMLHDIFTTFSQLRYRQTLQRHQRQKSAPDRRQVHVHRRDLWTILGAVEQSLVLHYATALDRDSMAEAATVVHHHHRSTHFLHLRNHDLGTV